MVPALGITRLDGLQSARRKASKGTAHVPEGIFVFLLLSRIFVKKECACGCSLYLLRWFACRGVCVSACVRERVCVCACVSVFACALVV